MSDEALRAETLDAIEARHADELAAVRAVTAGMTAKRDKTAVLKMEGAVTDRHYEEMRRWEQLAGVGSEEDEEGEEEEDPPANDDRDDDEKLIGRSCFWPKTNSCRKMFRTKLFKRSVQIDLNFTFRSTSGSHPDRFHF